MKSNIGTKQDRHSHNRTSKLAFHCASLPPRGVGFQILSGKRSYQQYPLELRRARAGILPVIAANVEGIYSEVWSQKLSQPARLHGRARSGRVCIGAWFGGW